jgi:hypothetical protein
MKLEEQLGRIHFHLSAGLAFMESDPFNQDFDADRLTQWLREIVREIEEIIEDIEEENYGG